MRRRCIAAVLAACAAAPAACRHGPAPPGADRPQAIATADPGRPPLPRLPVERDAPDAGPGVGGTVDNLRLTTLLGATLTLDDLLHARRGVVIAMTSVTCPIARKYAPRLAAIERDFDGQFAFVYVNPVDAEPPAAMREAAADAGLRGSYARDAEGAVRRALRPTTTTEVVVLDAARRVVYRGAVDDGFRFGGTAAQVRRHYLRDALAAAAAGRPPPVALTTAPGCLVDPPPDARDAPAAAESPPIPFEPAVAGVLARNCAACHSARGPAPFELASPADLAGRSAMVAAVVREEVMPPNHGLAWSGPGPLVRARRMPREDRELLLAWLDSPGAAAGATAAPGVDSTPAPARPSPSRVADAPWAIGAPDLILVSPGPRLATDDPPRTGRFLVPVNLDADRWVEAVECRPVMHGSVEVASVWLVRPGMPLPAPDRQPADAELLATYSATDPAVAFEPGEARRLPTGSVLVCDILARSMGRPMHGQLRIALRFAPRPPRREVHALGVAPDALAVAPGDPDARVIASRVLERPARLRALTPVLGPRAREVAVELHVRGRPPVTLLDLRRYDWRWLIRYPLVDPIDVPAGARIVMRARLDNSAANPANPDAGVPVSLGVGPGREAVHVSVEWDGATDAPGAGPAAATAGDAASGDPAAAPPRRR